MHSFVKDVSILGTPGRSISRREMLIESGCHINFGFRNGHKPPGTIHDKIILEKSRVVCKIGSS
jgi:hypothetical protein